jgi:hypothetical protein
MLPLDAGFRKPALCLSFLAPALTGEIMLMRLKNKEKWNGAGTFGFLVTLMKMNAVKSAREGLRGLSWRTDYD